MLTSMSKPAILVPRDGVNGPVNAGSSGMSANDGGGSCSHQYRINAPRNPHRGTFTKTCLLGHIVISVLYIYRSSIPLSPLNLPFVSISNFSRQFTNSLLLSRSHVVARTTPFKLLVCPFQVPGVISSRCTECLWSSSVLLRRHCLKSRVVC